MRLKNNFNTFSNCKFLNTNVKNYIVISIRNMPIVVLSSETSYLAMIFNMTMLLMATELILVDIYLFIYKK